MIPLWIPITCIIGGGWVFQDALASILFYLNRPDERWHFNHAVRIIRGLIGIMFLIIGIILILDNTHYVG